MEKFYDQDNKKLGLSAEAAEEFDLLLRAGWSRKEIEKMFAAVLDEAEKAETQRKEEARKGRFEQHCMRGRENLINALNSYYLAFTDEPMSEEAIKEVEGLLIVYEQEYGPLVTSLIKQKNSGEPIDYFQALTDISKANERAEKRLDEKKAAASVKEESAGQRKLNETLKPFGGKASTSPDSQVSNEISLVGSNYEDLCHTLTDLAQEVTAIETEVKYKDNKNNNKNKKDNIGYTVVFANKNKNKKK